MPSQAEFVYGNEMSKKKKKEKEKNRKRAIAAAPEQIRTQIPAP